MLPTVSLASAHGRLKDGNEWKAYIVPLTLLSINFDEFNDTTLLFDPEMSAIEVDVSPKGELIRRAFRLRLLV